MIHLTKKVPLNATRNTGDLRHSRIRIWKGFVMTVEHALPFGRNMSKARAAVFALSAATFLSFAVAPTRVSAQLVTQSSPIFVEGSFEEISTAGKVFTEGVVAAPDGRIFFTDMNTSAYTKDAKGLMGGRIFTFDPKSGQTILFREPSLQANGLHFDIDGDLIAAEGADYGGRRVSRTNLKTGDYRIIAADYRGRPFNAPNDITSDRSGRIYFTDTRYVGHEPLEQSNGVYRIERDGRIVRLISDLNHPNGIDVSPDGKTLYVSIYSFGGFNIVEQSPDRFNRAPSGGIVAYDLSPDGDLSNPRTILDTNREGGVDGMALDTEGNIYAGVGGSDKKQIVVYSPTGKQLATLSMPGKLSPTNLGFGRGTDAQTLYITVQGKGALYRIRTTKTGYYVSSAK